MADFDPYYKWLGIPPKEQPPNHYRLLGVTVFEPDGDVIDAAADRQMSYVKNCATGEHVQASQKLLNELSAARLCLLTPARRAAYDTELKAKLAPPPPPEEPKPAKAAEPAAPREAARKPAAKRVVRLEDAADEFSETSDEELDSIPLRRSRTMAQAPVISGGRRTGRGKGKSGDSLAEKLWGSTPARVVTSSVAGLMLIVGFWVIDRVFNGSEEKPQQQAPVVADNSPTAGSAQKAETAPDNAARPGQGTTPTEPAPAVATSPPATTTKAAPAVKPQRTAFDWSTPPDFAAERAVAEWVNDGPKGQAVLATPSGQHLNYDRKTLPSGEFLISMLNFYRVTQLSGEDLQRLQKLRGLKSLQFQNVLFTGEAFKPLYGCPTIESVNINNGDIEKDPWTDFASFPNLSQLNIRGARLSGEGFEALRGHPRLNFVTLSNVEVHDAVFETLAALPGLNFLEVSNEWGVRIARITNEGPRQLHDMKLHTLDLGNTDITDAALPGLKNISNPGNPLNTLKLDGTAITDAGVAALQELTGLDKLILCRTRVTSAGTAKLRVALPKCRVAGPTDNDEIPAADLEDDPPPKSPPSATAPWPTPRLVLRSMMFDPNQRYVQYTLAIANWRDYPESIVQDPAGVGWSIHGASWGGGGSPWKSFDQFKQMKRTMPLELVGTQLYIKLKNPQTKAEYQSNAIVLKCPPTPESPTVQTAAPSTAAAKPASRGPATQPSAATPPATGSGTRSDDERPLIERLRKQPVLLAVDVITANGEWGDVMMVDPQSKLPAGPLKLRQLLCQSSQPPETADLRAVGQTTSLLVVDLGSGEIDDAGLDGLVASRTLFSLTLRTGKLSEGWPAKLSALSSLTTLSVTGSAVTDTALSRLPPLPKLRRLQLEDGKFTAAGLRGLPVRSLSNLAVRRTPIGDDGLKAVRDFPSLTDLELEQVAATVQGFRHLNGSSVRTLRLTGREIRDAEIEGLRGQPLSVLFLTRPELTDASLGPLSTLQNLTSITVNETPIRGEAWTPEKGCWSKLKFAAFPNCKWTDKGVKSLADAAPNLDTLFLHDNSITNAAGADLARLTHLRNLWVQSTELKIAGLLQLKPLKELKDLNASCTPAEAAEIWKFVPACRINGWMLKK